MPRYELRLTLPDHPGSLGAAAQELGRAGANIVSFEAVESADGTAVDQLVVDLDAGAVTDAERRLDALEGVDVEVLRPFPQRPMFDGPLELIEALVRLRPDEVPQALVDGLPAATRVSWAVVVASRQPQPLRVAASVGAPTLVGASTPWMPLARAQVLDPAGDWVPRRWGLDPVHAALAAAPLDDGGDTALLVVRKQGPAFRRRELRVLAALALVGGRLDDAVEPPP